MADGHGRSLLALVAAGVSVDEAAQRLLEDGADIETLDQVEEFLSALETDPSARDRARLLVEQTRLLAERGTAGARRSDGLRADATVMRTANAGVAAKDISRMLHHELSAPIMVARTALELLQAPGDERATAEQLVEMALRSLRLAGRLLESWGRAEHLRMGGAELSWAQVELGEVVGECVADVGVLGTGQHEFVVRIERIIDLPADSDAVRQILFNLLINAAKFSPSGSQIEVTVSSTNEHAEVAVRDRGPGISPQDAERIFEAGQRVDLAAPGMGLGLFVARQLARAHGGELHVESVSGGSRFVLHLPLSAAEWRHSLERREDAASAREAGQRQRDASRRGCDAVADARDAELDQREAVADQRDGALDSREALAYDRDADLDRRGRA